MKTTHIFLGLVMLCGTAFGTPAPIITTTPTNGPTTVTVHARTPDGKLPVGVECKIMYAVAVRPGIGEMIPITNPPPLFVGTNGDWTATNVSQGIYEIALRGTNYAQNPPKYLQIFAGTNYNVDFVLSSGVAFKGRLLDDATSKPIKNATIYCLSSRTFEIRTDAEGRYELSHAGATVFIEAHATNYVSQNYFKVDAAAEDSTVSVPDIRLKHGGWISGRVERPADKASNESALVSAEIQGTLLTNSPFLTESDTDGKFRTEPLPSGTYTLRAEWVTHTTNGGRLPIGLLWSSVSNINVNVGRETTNVFISTKMTIQTNSTGGR